MFNMWNFRQISHPMRGRPIWMPQGMGLQQYPNKNGLSYRDPQGRFRVLYNYFPDITAEFVYADTLNKMKMDGTFVHYSVIKDGWFVISATSAIGEDRYLRYHQDGSGILGFVAFWNNANGVVNGERIAVLMSASLGSVMNGRPFVEPPGFLQEAPASVAAAPAVVPVSRPDPAVIPRRQSRLHLRQAPLRHRQSRSLSPRTRSRQAAGSSSTHRDGSSRTTTSSRPARTWS